MISGVIPDQAALHDLLNRIRDLGLRLVSVHTTRITAPQPQEETVMSMQSSTDTATGTGTAASGWAWRCL